MAIRAGRVGVNPADVDPIDGHIIGGGGGGSVPFVAYDIPEDNTIRIHTPQKIGQAMKIELYPNNRDVWSKQFEGGIWQETPDMLWQEQLTSFDFRNSNIFALSHWFIDREGYDLVIRLSKKEDSTKVFVRIVE